MSVINSKDTYVFSLASTCKFQLREVIKHSRQCKPSPTVPNPQKSLRDSESKRYRNKSSIRRRLQLLLSIDSFLPFLCFSDKVFCKIHNSLEFDWPCCDYFCYDLLECFIIQSLKHHVATTTCNNYPDTQGCADAMFTECFIWISLIWIYHHTVYEAKHGVSSWLG